MEEHFCVVLTRQSRAFLVLHLFQDAGRVRYMQGSSLIIFSKLSLVLVDTRYPLLGLGFLPLPFPPELSFPLPSSQDSGGRRILP